MRNARRTTWLNVALLAATVAAGTRAACAASVEQRELAAVIGREEPYRAFEGDPCDLERRLFADAADGQLEEFSLLEASLVASGADEPASLEKYQKRVDELVNRLRANGDVTGSPRQRAQAVFEFMHREILRGGYRLDCTDVRILLDRGQFNCVSAAVMFDVLASRFGLRVCGLEVPGHAMSCLLLPEGNLEIETTCAGWFQVIGNPQKQAEAVRNALGRAALRGGSPAYRAVTDVELTAAIYYNRGVDLLAAERFADALAANAKALRLDPRSETARGNLLAVLNNWAISLGGRGDYARAAQMLRRGLALAPDYGTLTVNYVHVCHRWSEALCGEARFAEAANVLSVAARERPDETFFREALGSVYRRWARAVVAGADAERTPVAAPFSFEPGHTAPVHSGPTRPGSD